MNRLYEIGKEIGAGGVVGLTNLQKFDDKFAMGFGTDLRQRKDFFKRGGGGGGGGHWYYTRTFANC